MARSIRNKKRNTLSTLQADAPTAPQLPLEPRKRRTLAGWPMILGWLAMLIFAFHASTHMVGAGDTWVAMTCGRHFINHGVDTVEPFSANSHKPGPTPEEVKTWPKWAQWLTDKVGLETVKYWHPTGWINQNWLTHVIFYSLIPESSYEDGLSFSSNALVYWKFAIYILAVMCVYYIGRLLGAHPALCAVFACFAMFVGRSFLDVRPAGFSNLLVAVFLLILVLTTYRNILYIWLIIPLTVFWCNVHGGYIYMFIVLVPFVALNLLTSLSKKRFVSIGLRGIYHTIAAGFVAFLAVILFNPFHLTNLTHTFVISVSEHAERWRDVNEWHRAFEWTNPVGTGFPFLVLFVLSIGLTLLWLFSYLLKPRFLKAPKNELEAQKKLFTTLSKILGCAAAVLICWVTFISFSFLSLDAASFFICALFVLLVLLGIHKSVHYIYLVILLTLLALWSGASTPGYAGRYIYSFILLPAYVVLHFFASTCSKKVKFKPGNIVFVAAAAILSLFLMTVIFEPFRKFSLTPWPYKETISCVKIFFVRVWTVLTSLDQFLHLSRPWRPSYEVPAQSYKHLFAILYIVNILSVVLWLTIPYLKSFFTATQDKTATQPHTDDAQYQWPKIDLSLMLIAALTIYMAICSRRFIPIAAIAACPIIAMFIDQIIRAISATVNFHKQNRFAVSPMPHDLQFFFIVAGAAAVLIFGTGWGFKFKRIYLDAWPTDTKLNSVFMRMTASDAKPFYALKFIKDNKLKGKMFNYWTEGGFIAWGQKPDPNTGRTPLQLFMDGRAQAAYDCRAYELWSTIISGGPIVRDARVRARLTKQKIEKILTLADYTKIGRWVDERLKKEKAWVVLMPSAAYTDSRKASYHFVKGLEHNPNWPLVFYNNKQKLFVDAKTSRGRELFDGISNGKTLYPDDFSRNLTLAHNLFLFAGNDKTKRKQALDFAIKAFESNPSQAPIREIIYVAGRFPELRPDIKKFCENYFNDFTKKKDTYVKEDGYFHRIVAALNAGDYLRAVAKKQNNTRDIQFYNDRVKEYKSEQNRLLKRKRW